MIALMLALALAEEPAEPGFAAGPRTDAERAAVEQLLASPTWHYEVDFDRKNYGLTLQRLDEPGFGFAWEMTSPKNARGLRHVPPEVLASCTEQHNTFAHGEDLTETSACSATLSTDAYARLVAGETVRIGQYAVVKAVAEEGLLWRVDGEPVVLPVLRLVNQEDERQEIWVLRNPELPLIIEQVVGFRVWLVSNTEP